MIPWNISLGLFFVSISLRNMLYGTVSLKIKNVFGDGITISFSYYYNIYP